MTLHDLYDVLGDGLISLVQRVPHEGDYELYTGTAANFPYHLMRDYGDCDVLLVYSSVVYLPGKTTDGNGIRIVINRDEEDY